MWEIPRWLYTFVVVMVTVTWTSVTIAGYLGGKPPDASFNYVMGAIAGSVGGFGIVAARGRNGKGGGDDDRR